MDFPGNNRQIANWSFFLSILPEKRLQMYFDDLQASQNLAWSWFANIVHSVTKFC